MAMRMTGHLLGAVVRGRYIDREGELRPARPGTGRVPSLLPPAAQPLQQSAREDSRAE
jgi:hypothetical protein